MKNNMANEKFLILSRRPKPMGAFNKWNDVEKAGVRMKSYQS